MRIISVISDRKKILNHIPSLLYCSLLFHLLWVLSHHSLSCRTPHLSDPIRHRCDVSSHRSVAFPHRSDVHKTQSVIIGDILALFTQLTTHSICQKLLCRETENGTWQRTTDHVNRQNVTFINSSSNRVITASDDPNFIIKSVTNFISSTGDTTSV